MYSKEEAYQRKKRFWISFGQYMSLQPSNRGAKVNWLNYKTGIKDLYFRIKVNNHSASVFIEISSKDTKIQQKIYEKFEMFQDILTTYLHEKWIWNFGVYDEQGKIISTIGITKENISIFRETDWGEIISFCKENLLALDNFWSNYKEAFLLE
ncbi:DUF4268 domain-containing protein [Apibacter adventoris]|uniref:DUF4268 domain-containing protein n=1 Tax=Apibacter adventoris TaxID=1679466 RepID=UPI000CF6F749|nr:DUF4268 domain-containing protein [Apibacter adventoris]PQL94706.1 DUF4268 domain-containing protein [Apibacter adventoris]